MVLMYLNKVAHFADTVANTPLCVSKRKFKLIREYNMLADDISGVVVSVKIPALLERVKEIHLDSEDENKKVKILEYFIDKYTTEEFILTASKAKKYLIPSPKICLRQDCCGTPLNLSNPSRTDNTVHIFTQRGGLKGEVYRKKCPKCEAVYYYNYFEKKDDVQVVRKYYDGVETYFSVTNASFFEKEMLENLTEDIGMN